jgi:hypothetical protein
MSFSSLSPEHEEQVITTANLFVSLTRAHTPKNACCDILLAGAPVSAVHASQERNCTEAVGQ